MSTSPRSGESPPYDVVPPRDQLRAEVEATLQRVVIDVLRLPCQAARTTRSAARDAVRTVTQPIAVTRSVIGLVSTGLLGQRGQPHGPGPVSTRSTPARPGNGTDSAPRPPVTATADDNETVMASTLPLDDYQSLPASHVVARLARLSRTELEAVRDFEDAHRGRRTVLGRIEQLLAER